MERMGKDEKREAEEGEVGSENGEEGERRREGSIEKGSGQ
jgi:hypothetical protein